MYLQQEMSTLRQQHLVGLNPGFQYLFFLYLLQFTKFEIIHYYFFFLRIRASLKGIRSGLLVATTEQGFLIGVKMTILDSMCFSAY